jgi:3-deoxy-D-manno-octulosonic acid (KDO) 8-phosphate synthase
MPLSRVSSDDDYKKNTTQPDDSIESSSDDEASMDPVLLLSDEKSEGSSLEEGLSLSNDEFNFISQDFGALLLSDEEDEQVAEIVQVSQGPNFWSGRQIRFTEMMAAAAQTPAKPPVILVP